MKNWAQRSSPLSSAGNRGERTFLIRNSQALHFHFGAKSPLEAIGLPLIVIMELLSNSSILEF